MKHDIFAQQIRQHFDYLFDDYGFLVIHKECHGEKRGNTIVVLESATHRIRILLESEQVLLDIGPLWAPVEWSVSAPNEWFGLTYIVGFLSNGTDELEYVFPDTSLDAISRVAQQLARLSIRLQPYCDQIARAFRPEAFEQTQQELMEYQDSQVELWMRQHR